MKRSVKTYRDKGPSGFYGPRATRGAAVLIDAVVVEAEELLAEGASEAEVAERLALKPNTLHKAIRAGRVRSPLKKTADRRHDNCGPVARARQCGWCRD